MGCTKHKTENRYDTNTGSKPHEIQINGHSQKEMKIPTFISSLKWKCEHNRLVGSEFPLTGQECPAHPDSAPLEPLFTLHLHLLLHFNHYLQCWFCILTSPSGCFWIFFVNFVNKRTCLGGHWESTIELVFPWPLSVNLPVSVNLRSCPIIPRSPLWGSNRRQCSPNCLFLPHSHSLAQGWTRPRTLTIVGCRTIHRGFGRSTFPLKLDGDDDNDVEGGGGCGVLSEDERTEYRRRVLTPKTAGRRRKRGGGVTNC